MILNSIKKHQQTSKIVGISNGNLAKTFKSWKAFNDNYDINFSIRITLCRNVCVDISNGCNLNFQVAERTKD